MLKLTILLLFALFVSACAMPPITPVADSAPTAAPVPEATEVENTGTENTAPENTEAVFPVTIEHQFGSTTLTAFPERIVTVGLTDHDALIALGIVPVGTTEWFNEYPGAVWPWASDKLNGAELPTVVGTAVSINFEGITALQPDLILALYAGVSESDYQLLTQIAPTIVQPAGYVDYGMPWQEITRVVGQAVGKADEAEALIAAIDDRFAQLREEYPEFVGATAVAATPYEGIWVYSPQDSRGRLLTQLGFELPEGLAEVTGDEYGGILSAERAEMLDVDVIIWLDADESEGPLGGPIYQTLPVHTEGREILLDSYDEPLGGATSFVSVLSLPYLLDGLVPRLAEVLAGTGN